MSSNYIQKFFCPVDYHFEWTLDDWYKWDSVGGHKEARKQRDLLAKELKKEGYKVSKTSLPGQLITRGGIGSGHGQFEFIVTAYGLNAYR